MKTLMKKHQQNNERRRVQFSPEVQAYIQSQLNFVPGMNITSNTSVQQINQQARQNEKVEREIPKTKAEGSYKNVERRRKSGKTKDQEDTERDIKLAMQPTWRTNVADAFITMTKEVMKNSSKKPVPNGPKPTVLSNPGGGQNIQKQGCC